DHRAERIGPEVDRLLRTDELEVVRIAVAFNDRGEHAVVGLVVLFFGARDDRGDEATAHVDHRRLQAALALDRVDLGHVVDRLALGRLKLRLPARDVGLDAAAPPGEARDDELAVAARAGDHPLGDAQAAPGRLALPLLRGR